MTDKKNTYSKIIIEIADKIYGNPDIDLSSIVSFFGKKCQKSERTIWRWVSRAHNYNQERISKQEKIREEQLSIDARNAINSEIISRNESLKILSEIAKGVARNVDNSIIIPSDSDRTKAIIQISKMQGWEAPIKSAQTDSDGNDLKELKNKDILKFIREITKDYSKY